MRSFSMWHVDPAPQLALSSTYWQFDHSISCCAFCFRTGVAGQAVQTYTLEGFSG